MRLSLILLACIAHIAAAQYQDRETGGLSQRGQSPIPIKSIRFQRPAGKPIAPGQSGLSNQRARRPYPLRVKDDTLGPGGGFRPLRPNFPSGPGPSFAQQVKPVTEESYEEDEKPHDTQQERAESREQSEEQDDEPEEDESGENFARTVTNSGTTGIGRGPGNFGPSAGIPQQQQPPAVQYRPFGGNSGPGNARLGNTAPPPIQYRPSPKPAKPRKQQVQLSEEEQPVKQVKPPSKPVKPSQVAYDSRGKKPVAQTIRRYRHDNDDGSITWGFENDDGSYKEEIIGVDCITRGKYGYIDADGFRREYTYETGIKCDEEERDEDEAAGFVDYQENKLVLPNGKTVDLSSMGKKQTRRPGPVY